MITHAAKLFARHLFYFCFLNLAATPALAYWINYDANNLEWSLLYTKSDTPEGAAQRRCEIQYHGTKPLDTFWFIETKDGHPIYGFTCGNIYTVPSSNTVRWFACPIDGHVYSSATGSCEPLEQICGAGGYTHAFGRCLNRNLGSSSCPTAPLVGNPINAATGNKVQTEIDVSLPHNRHLRLSRTYNSLQNSDSHSLFGNNWRSNFDVSIEYQTAWGMHRAILHRPDGNTLLFELRRNEWIGPKNAASILESAADEKGNFIRWSLTHADGTSEVFDASGRLAALTDPESGTTSMTYDTAGRLVSAEGPRGRSMQFAYDDTGRLIGVTDPLGKIYRYAYDASGNLSELRYPDRTQADTSDNPRRSYLYEDKRFPAHLTGIVDERGRHIASWTYDEYGRAISSQGADGTDHFRLTYIDDDTTIVTDPLGYSRRFEFSDQNGWLQTASVVGGDCRNCSTQAESFTFDLNGYIASRTDHAGNTVHYERDLLGRELVRTEALGTPEERTITTSWHPVFGRPLVVSEPGRATYYTYDSNGLRISTTVRSQP